MKIVTKLDFYFSDSFAEHTILAMIIVWMWDMYIATNFYPKLKS